MVDKHTVATLYQYGIAGSGPENRKFFEMPPVSLDEMRAWMKEGAGADAIGVGAVVNEQGTIVGELVMPGGHDAYMIGEDGKAKPVPANYKILFAQIGHMEPQEPVTLTVTNKADLQRQLTELLPPGQRDAYMVRVTGNFADIRFRTVDANGREITTMPQLVNPPTSFQFRYQNAQPYQLVGFYSKKGMEEEGTTFDDALHLHGVDPVHRKGGHLNDFGNADGTIPTQVKVEIMPIGSWLTATRLTAQGQQLPSATWQWQENSCGDVSHQHHTTVQTKTTPQVGQ